MINVNPPDPATVQSWLAFAMSVATGAVTIYIMVMQRINNAKLETKTDAQSAKLDEIHTQTVNGTSKLATIPGDPSTVPPIPKG
jgi:hypothetical protein